MADLQIDLSILVQHPEDFPKRRDGIGQMFEEIHGCHHITSPCRHRKPLGQITHEQAPDFFDKYKEAGFEVDPKDEASLIAFQSKLEAGGMKYYLNATQIRTQPLDVPLKVYQRKEKG